MTQPFNRWPFDVDHLKGYTAYLPDGIYTGKGLAKALNHAINWRFDGYHMLSAGWRPNGTTNDATGKFYPIMHYPPKRDGGDRGIAIGWTIWGNPANGAWALYVEDVVAGYAQETIASGDNDAPPMSEATGPWHVGVHNTVYEPPAAGAANLHQGNFKALEMECTNAYVGAIGIWHIEEEAELPDAQVKVKTSDVAPGKIISELDESLLGIHEWIGDGSTDAESLERLSRRMYFNEAHVTGINIAAGSAYGSIISGADAEYPAEARDFAWSATQRASYPALVITTDGVDATHTARIRYSTAADAWIYTVQNAEPDNTPYIITPAMAGSSDANGLTVADTPGDSILVEAMTDAGVTLTIHSWACFEGPAW